MSADRHLEVTITARDDVVIVTCPVPWCDPVRTWEFHRNDRLVRVRTALYSHLRARHGIDGRQRMILVSGAVLPLRVPAEVA